MQIVVLIDKSGDSQTLVKGEAGPTCMQTSKFLTDALGTIISDTPTEEYEGIQLFGTTQQTVEPVRRVQMRVNT